MTHFHFFFSSAQIWKWICLHGSCLADKTTHQIKAQIILEILLLTNEMIIIWILVFVYLSKKCGKLKINLMHKKCGKFKLFWFIYLFLHWLCFKILKLFLVIFTPVTFQLPVFVRLSFSHFLNSVSQTQQWEKRH